MPSNARMSQEATAVAINRYVFDHALAPPKLPIDELGFVQPSARAPLRPLQSVLKFPCAVITAPPWTGKTFVAQRLRQRLQDFADQRRPVHDKAPVLHHVHLTRLDLPEGLRQPKPPWWQQWMAGTDHAAWVVDALDEGHHREPGIHSQLIETLRAAHTSLDRLCVLIFSREESDLIQDFLEQLREIYQKPLQPPARFGLAGLDRAEAEHILRSKNLQPLDEVAKVINACRLQGVAQFPAVLTHLGSLSPGSKTDIPGVWKGVLCQLLDEPAPSRPKPQCELEDRFNAAAQAAAALTLTDHEAVSARFDRGLKLEDLIPDTQSPLRQAMREALNSAVFREHSLGRIFTQRHVQEWFCAYALQNLPLSRLRPLLVDKNGNIPAPLRGVAAILPWTSFGQEVRDWLLKVAGGIPFLSDLAGWTFDEAVGFIDRIELAITKAKAVPIIEEPENLRHLAVPGVADNVAKRVLDRAREVYVRDALLDVLEYVDANAGLETVVRIIKDEAEPLQLRRSAASYLLEHGTKAEAEQVRDNVPAPAEPGNEINQFTAALVLLIKRAGLEQFPQILRRTPGRRNTRVKDMVARLHLELQNSLDAASARHVIERLLDEDRLGVLDGSALSGLFRKSLKVMLEQPMWLAPDVKKLVRVVAALSDTPFDYQIIEKLETRLLSDTSSRKMLYKAIYERLATRKHQWSSRWALAILRDEGFGRFLDLAKAAGSDSIKVWKDVLNLAETWQNPRLTLEERKQVRTEAELAHQGIVAANDDMRRRARQERAALLKELKTRKVSRPKKRSLAVALRKALQSDDPDGTKMIEVANLCFAPDWAAPAGVEGSWEELPTGLQAAALNACRDGLTNGSPTTIRAPRTISYLSVCEAVAFQALVTRASDTSWVDRDLISKWLPVCLHALSEDAGEVLLACARIDLEATHRVLKHEVEGEVRTFSGSLSKTERIPEELWGLELSQALVSLAASRRGRVSGRAALLRAVSARRPNVTAELAKQWAQLPSSANDELRLAGFECWLVSIPSEAWPAAKKLIEERGLDVLEKLTCLWDHRQPLACDFKAWPPLCTAELGALLFQHLPVEKFTRRDGPQGPHEHLVDVREYIPRLLWSRREHEALKQFASTSEHVAFLYASWRAEEEIATVAGGVGSPQIGANLEIDELVRTLAKGDYRVIRDEHDLIEAVRDALQHVAKTIGYDVELLYSAKADGRAHHLENVLQAYVASRLRDLLPTRYLARETQVKFRRRHDILVEAPTVGGELAKVIIELKWSDNDDVCSSLNDQLVEEYLISEGNSAGIYLVAWSGGKVPGYTTLLKDGPPTLERMRGAFEKQAREAIERVPSLRLAVVVLDAAWEA